MKKILSILSILTVAALLLPNASFAEGDAVKGAKVFKKCKACHSIEKGGRNLVGPNLFGIVGKKSAQREGYKYSPAMAAANVTWDEATLDIYLTKPGAMVNKTKMTFAGLKKAEQRADVIAYLKTFK